MKDALKPTNFHMHTRAYENAKRIKKKKETPFKVQIYLWTPSDQVSQMAIFFYKYGSEKREKESKIVHIILIKKPPNEKSNFGNFFGR